MTETDTDEKRWEFRDHSLFISTGTSWDEFTESIWSAAQNIHSNSNFWLGDSLNWATDNFPEQWSQLVDADIVEQARTAMWVCRKIPPERRRPKLRWSHHRVIAGVNDVAEQDRWFDLTEKNAWTVRDLNEAVKARKEETSPPREPSRPGDNLGPQIEADDLDLSKPLKNGNGAFPVEQAQPVDSKAATEAALVEQVRSIIRQIRSIQDLAMAKDDWRVQSLNRSDEAGWVIDLYRGDKRAIGNSYSLITALLDAALSAMISDIGGEEPVDARTFADDAALRGSAPGP